MNDTILGIIIGGLLSSIPTLIITATTLREERRRRMIDAAVQCAIAEWREAREMALAMSKNGHRVRLAPMSSYYIGALLLLRATESSKSEEEVKADVQRAIRTTREILSANETEA